MLSADNGQWMTWLFRECQMVCPLRNDRKCIILQNGNEIKMRTMNSNGRTHSPSDAAGETSVHLVNAAGQLNCITVVWMKQKIVTKLHHFVNRCCWRSRRCCCRCPLSLTISYSKCACVACIECIVGVGMDAAKMMIAFTGLLCAIIWIRKPLRWSARSSHRIDKDNAA